MQNDPFPAPDSSRSLIWALVVAGGIIVLLAVVLLYTLARGSASRIPPTPQPTDTSQPSPTVLPPTWTPVPPTETPTSTPTPAPPTPTEISGDPAAALGAPSGIEPFDTANNWTLFDSDCFKSEIKGGMLVMTAKGKMPGACWEVSWPSIQDYYLQSDVQMPDACQPEDLFGLFFRAPDHERGYLFGLSCDGRYSLTTWDGESAHRLADLGANPAIKTGAGQINRVGVLAGGSALTLYANGRLLTRVQDPTFTKAGLIGYFVSTVSREGFTVKFDNLTIWLLNSESVGSERGFLPGISVTSAAPNPTAYAITPTATVFFPTYAPSAFTPTSTPKFVADIIGPTWYLAQYTTSSGTKTAIQDPDLYWLRLNPDGSLDARGDCNTAYGVFTLHEANLSIDLAGGSGKTCDTVSFSDTYFSALEGAGSYNMDKDQLVILLGGGGYLRFSP